MAPRLRRLGCSACMHRPYATCYARRSHDHVGHWRYRRAIACESQQAGDDEVASAAAVLTEVCSAARLGGATRELIRAAAEAEGARRSSTPHDLTQMRRERSKVKARLREYEAAFEARTGRKPHKKDWQPVSTEKARYGTLRDAEAMHSAAMRQVGAGPLLQQWEPLLDDRPALLRELERRGISSVPERESFANALAAASRGGRLPHADLGLLRTPPQRPSTPPPLNELEAQAVQALRSPAAQQVRARPAIERAAAQPIRAAWVHAQWDARPPTACSRPSRHALSGRSAWRRFWVARPRPLLMRSRRSRRAEEGMPRSRRDRGEIEASVRSRRAEEGMPRTAIEQTARLPSGLLRSATRWVPKPCRVLMPAGRSPRTEVGQRVCRQPRARAHGERQRRSGSRLPSPPAVCPRLTRASWWHRCARAGCGSGSIPTS